MEETNNCDPNDENREIHEVFGVFHFIDIS